MSAPWPLHRRLMLGFAVFTLIVAGLFGTYSIVFTYAVEDQFFEDALQAEAAVQHEHYASTGRWMSPRLEYMSVHASPASFPADLRERHDAEPMRSELAGENGRHYHLLRLTPATAGDSGAFLVAEVSQQLVVRRVRNNLLQLLVWSLLAMMTLAMLVGYWLARQIAAPLTTLAGRVESMQPDDPPQVFGRQFSTREIGVLAHGLEALTERVHAFVMREREFTRDASHELRTPLAMIHSTCERLLRDASLSGEARRQVDLLKHSAWQLQQTVTTLLSLAREENAAMHGESVMVLPLLEQVVVEQSVLLEGKPVEVAVQVPREARVSLPSAVLRILLGNLVGNAFAHTAVGRVLIDVDNGRLRIANADCMAEAVHDTKYQPFVKGEGSAGYGLGLAIVRRFCDRYGIDLTIETGSHGTTTSLALDGDDAAL